MTMQFFDPVLNADERATLVSAADPLKVAARTLDKLDAIGFDVTEHRDLVARTEAQRAGLLKAFGVRRPTAK